MKHYTQKAIIPMAILFIGIELGTNPESTTTTPLKLINGVQNVDNSVSGQDVIKKKNDTQSTNSLANDNLNVHLKLKFRLLSLL